MSQKPKKITNDKNYIKPDKTYQQTLTNQDIKEKLKEYKQVSDIKKVSIGTHIRYFAVDPKTKEKIFRLGGNLNKVDPEGRYVILSNGTVNWSVQIPNTIFFQKLTETELKEEMKKELKKEIMSESDNGEIYELKKEIKNLTKKIEQLKDIEKENKLLIKKNETLTYQIAKIEKELVKSKK
jgi:hypothetical protein